MLSDMKGYWRGLPVAWILIFIAALICSVARLGLLPGLEHGWKAAALSATASFWLWPVPVFAIIAILVWTLPEPRIAPPRSTPS